jgi:hypothetical protein
MDGTKRVGVMMDLEQSNSRPVRILAGIHEYADQNPAWRLVLDDWPTARSPTARERPLRTTAS